METKMGFTKMTPSEFSGWIRNQRIARTIVKIQQHHTFLPDYRHFTGNNHFDRQQSMKHDHMVNNGWSDIGQHFTIFPDGMVVTGRNLEKTPACIYGQNANAVCIENFGNFDHNGDVMTSIQKEAIVTVTAGLITRFNLPVNTQSIIYHHWYDLSTGQRNASLRNKKSCPGENFFGGNKEQDCENNFMPLIINSLSGSVPSPATPAIFSYAFVTASLLNIRTAPDASSPKAHDRDPVNYGTVLRVFDEQSGWMKISNSQSHWVFGRYTLPVKRARVTAGKLNIRTGPGGSFPKTGSLNQNESVFIFGESNGWARIDVNDLWVSMNFLDIDV
jgi:hypothetical protein